MKIVLARHGETEWNVLGRIQGSSDIPLNGRGREQADELGRRLRASGARIDRLYASPAARAFETAEIAGRHLGLEPEVLRGVEEVRFGLWEGLTWEEAAAGWPVLCPAFRHDRFTVRPPEGENYEDMLSRVDPALAAVRDAGEGTALVVCHGGVMRALFSRRDGVPCDERMHERYPVLNCAWAAL